MCTSYERVASLLERVDEGELACGKVKELLNNFPHLIESIGSEGESLFAEIPR